MVQFWLAALCSLNAALLSALREQLSTTIGTCDLDFSQRGNKFTHSPQTTLVCKILFASFMIKRRHEPNSNCLCRASESWWNGFQSDPSRYQLNRVPRLPSAALKYWPHGFRDQNPVFIQTKIPNALDKFSISFQIRRTCAPTPCRAPQVD